MSWVRSLRAPCIVKSDLHPSPRRHLVGSVYVILQLTSPRPPHTKAFLGNLLWPCLAYSPLLRLCRTSFCRQGLGSGRCMAAVYRCTLVRTPWEAVRKFRAGRILWEGRCDCEFTHYQSGVIYGDPRPALRQAIYEILVLIKGPRLLEMICLGVACCFALQLASAAIYIALASCPSRGLRWWTIPAN